MIGKVSGDSLAITVDGSIAIDTAVSDLEASWKNELAVSMSN
jgi:hypothetical protein